MKGAQRIIIAVLLGIISLVPVEYTFADSNSRPCSVVEESAWYWPVQNLKEDWNYLFHPDRINQYKPRQLRDYRGPQW